MALVLKAMKHTVLTTNAARSFTGAELEAITARFITDLEVLLMLLTENAESNTHC